MDDMSGAVVSNGRYIVRLQTVDAVGNVGAACEPCGGRQSSRGVLIRQSPVLEDRLQCEEEGLCAL